MAARRLRPTCSGSSLTPLTLSVCFRGRHVQFIIVSHRNNMFELSDRLVGVYKVNNAAKAVAIDPAAFTIGVAAR